MPPSGRSPQDRDSQLARIDIAAPEAGAPCWLTCSRTTTIWSRATSLADDNYYKHAYEALASTSETET